MGIQIGRRHSISIGGSSGRKWERQWYGIQIDEANSSPDVTRIASDMRCHAELPVHKLIRGCLLKDDGTVNYYLNPADWTKKIDGTASNLDGTDGQVVNEWPTFYYKVEDVSATLHNITISLSNLAGYTKVNKHYMGVYEATLNRTTNKLASVKNASATYRGGNNNAAWDAAVNTLLGKPASNFTRTQGRSYARNRGAGWNLYGYNDHKWLYWFFVVEYATLNSQKAVNNTLTSSGYKQGGLGNGVTTAVPTEWNTFNTNYPFVGCGVTDSLGNGSGEVSVTITDFGGSGVNRTFTVPRYRGHENPFGHVWKILDGVNIEIQAADSGAESRLWTANNPADWDDANYTNYTNKGLLSRTEGYISKALMGAGAEFVPSTAGGGSATYYCDYFYTNIPSTGVALRMLLVGGAANSGAVAGFAFSSTSYAPSIANAAFGSRLRFEKPL